MWASWLVKKSSMSDQFCLYTIIAFVILTIQMMDLRGVCNLNLVNETPEFLAQKFDAVLTGPG